MYRNTVSFSILGDAGKVSRIKSWLEEKAMQAKADPLDSEAEAAADIADRVGVADLGGGRACLQFSEDGIPWRSDAHDFLWQEMQEKAEAFGLNGTFYREGEDAGDVEMIRFG